jgi:predicted enzyme related to lactoylglutathione lyase
MSNLNNYPQGVFCWAELCTHNWAMGNAFYTSLFDWGSEDQPIGDNLFYSMLQKQRDDVAAMYQMPQEQIDAGIPSNWLAYIAVDSVMECAEKAKKLGAEIIAGPHDVMVAGKMLLLKDPGGSIVALWEGNEHKGCKRPGEFNTPFWYELAAKNSQISRDFYCQLVGWQYEIKPMEGMDYTLFLVNGRPVAGMLEMTDEWPENTPPHWMIYFAVENCDMTTANAIKLGGQVCVPATNIPEVGRFSVLTDPQGAVFSLIESALDDVKCG